MFLSSVLNVHKESDNINSSKVNSSKKVEIKYIKNENYKIYIKNIISNLSI